MIYIGMRGDFEVRFPGKSRFSRLKRGKFREREGGGGAQMGPKNFVAPQRGRGCGAVCVFECAWSQVFHLFLSKNQFVLLVQKFKFRPQPY